MISILEFLAKKHQIEFSKEELDKAYDEIEYADNKLKKEIAKRFGISSNKWREIRLELCKLLQDLRKSKKKEDFDDIDIKHFRHLTINGIPQVYNKFKEYVKDENIEFIEYYYEYLEDKLYKSPKRKGKTLLEWALVWKNGVPRDWNYAISIADKRLIELYLCTLKYIEENK